MSLLHWLEQLRTGWLTAFFTLMTALGEETVFIAVFLIVLWCCERKYANRLFCVFFTGMFFNQLFKLVFRVPRPWVRDPALHPVESAKAGASGYSFPSGHTQSAVGLYGSFCAVSRRRWIRAACVVVILLVGLSRLYLGVHTPWDVLASLVIGTLVLIGCRALFDALEKTRLGELWALGGLCVLGAAAVAAGLLVPFLRDEAFENACRMLGCSLGMLLVAIADRFRPFEQRALWWQQLIKVGVGLPVFVLLKSLLKSPLNALLGAGAGDGVRYFILLVVAGAVYPLCFRVFHPHAKKKDSDAQSKDMV